ncbi:substrate-binding periplasmic protein [Vibrio sp. HN007]|uniref:substrate-binding periplasmic protein n=1 Tax=Vibrio iocasae TaxID=3098914 RepID=UPI0035D4ECD2
MVLRRTNIFVLMFLAFMLISLPFPMQANTIQIYTEDYPPYNYIEDGQPAGLSTEIVQHIMALAGLEYTIEFQPWARAMIIVENEPNTFVYSMRRLPSRESRFLWLGEIVTSQHSVFALKKRSDIKVEKVTDLIGYFIGTTIHDSRETLLIENGFPVENLTRISGRDAYERNYKKLKAGRIDVWPIDDAVAHHISRNCGDDPSLLLQKVYTFNEGTLHPYYLSTNLRTDPDIVEKVMNALVTFKKSREYKQILKRWGIETSE